MVSAVLSALFFGFFLHCSGLVIVVVFLAWTGVSFGMFISPNNNQAMSTIPDNERGTGSGIFNTTNTLGLALGVALLELILSRSVPHTGTSLENHLNQGGVSVADLLGGFERAYLFGTIVCIVALVFSSIILISDMRQRGTHSKNI
jgi:hypothetical protein